MSQYQDFLLRFPDRVAAIAAGVQRGATDEQTEQTATFVDPLNICVIGIHSYRSGGTDDEPAFVEAPGWWVLIRVPLNFPAATTLAALPVQVRPEIVTPDLEDPEIPNRVWF